MAEIDKSLPNVKQTINVPSPEEVQVDIQEQQQEQDSPIDIQPNEDGSVDFDFKVDKNENEFLINYAVKALMREGIIKATDDEMNEAEMNIKLKETLQ